MSHQKKKICFSSLLGLFFLLLTLSLLTWQSRKIQIWWHQATGQPANIVVDATAILGPLPQPWLALAQGGEEREPMLSPVIAETRQLKPRYIRLDHVFDAYNLIGGSKNGNMIYDFSQLDKTVDDILATDALPFFSLSYMPPTISKDSQVNSLPETWSDWSTIVKTFIEHYSGKTNRNLQNVYYEVWNEPDLFGNWKVRNCQLLELNCDPEKDYRTLYLHSALGAQQAKNTNPFYLGGPATTSFYPAWFDKLLEFAETKNLRLDFVSWHSYHPETDFYNQELEDLKTIMEKHPRFLGIKKIISEWGSDPENSPNHDSIFDAAHTVATSRALMARVDLAFAFEIKDGPDPAGNKYWGRWGLITHQNFGQEKKPRYYAFDFLNKLGPERLSLAGEGTWVKGIAAKDKEVVQILLVNYDPNNKHQESIPLKIDHLPPGEYLYEENLLLGKIVKEKISIGPEGLLEKNIYLPANSLILINLSSPSLR
jgi:xylan 1,4-beta-xylosidase